jgi:hypothetical protein
MKNIYVFLLILLLALTSCSFQSKKEKIFGTIQNCSELATMKVTLNKYLFAEKQNTILMIPAGKSKFTAQSIITLKYGINLNKINKNDIKIENNELHIALPPVELLDFNYSPEIEVIDEYTTMKNWVTQITGILEQAETSVKSNLKYLNMEDECKTKTNKLLENLFKEMKFSKIVITYKSGEVK